MSKRSPVSRHEPSTRCLAVREVLNRGGAAPGPRDQRPWQTLIRAASALQGPGLLRW
jgi:hypothetical protein